MAPLQLGLQPQTANIKRNDLVLQIINRRLELRASEACKHITLGHNLPFLHEKLGQNTALKVLDDLRSRR